MSPEQRAKISAAQMGKRHSQETREKLRVANLGKKPSPETCAKISAANLGQKRSPEAKAKMSAGQLGRKHSPETKAKIGASEFGNTYRRGPDYRAAKRYCARVYENAWGQIPREDSGCKYSIHHRDGNRHNDDPENLIALTVSEHATLEHALRRGDWDLAAEIDAVGVERRAGRG